MNLDSTVYWPRLVAGGGVSAYNLYLWFQLARAAAGFRLRGINGEIDLVLRASKRRAFWRMVMMASIALSAFSEHPPNVFNADRGLIFCIILAIGWLSYQSAKDRQIAEVLAASQLARRLRE